jgi:hypothetical protein
MLPLSHWHRTANSHCRMSETSCLHRHAFRRQSAPRRSDCFIKNLKTKPLKKNAL